MLVNLYGDQAKISAWRVMDKQMTILEKSMFNTMKPFINGQYIKTAQAVDNGDSDFYAYIKNSRKRLTDILFGYSKRIILTFASYLFDDVNKVKDDIRNAFWRSVQRFITEYTGLRVTQINATTLKQIKWVVQKGMAEGLSSKEIAKILRSDGAIKSVSRSNTIARTEVHTLANKGTLEASKAFKMKGKEWVSAIDERVRADHLIANGQRVAMDEKFSVGIDMLDYPGDPDGSPENTINCRCVLVYYN